MAKLRISIENTITGDLFHFRGSINTSAFDRILGYANRRVEMLTKGLDAGTAAFDDAIKRIQSKTVQLLNINNHLVHPRTSRDPGEMVVVYGEAVEGTKGEVTEGINSYGAIVRAAVGYHDLDNLFNDLKTFGTVNLSNYNVPESIFRGDGWQQYHNISSPPRFFYVRYGAVQIGYTLTQITLVETIAGNVSGNRYLIQNRVKHGMITEYCHHTHTLCVFILDFGPSLRNWEQIMTRLQGQHVFISRRMDGLLLETGSFWRAAIALVPYAKTVWETWEHLDYRETQSPLDYELFFELTFADQNDKYRGSVIRGIVGDFSDYTLRNEGHFASTKGIVYLTGFSLTWSYRGNVHHNL
ncbi:hypothetical protein M1N79_01590 [Dehalococcoidia bacterium]|nr:hypothetical protein [Dehalococcoidia bacterium]